MQGHRKFPKSHIFDICVPGGFLCSEAKHKKVQEAGSGISVCIAIVDPNYKPSEDCESQKHPANTTHDASLPLKIASKKEKKKATVK